MRRRNTIASVFKTDKNDENKHEYKHEYKQIPLKKRLKPSKINDSKIATFRTFIRRLTIKTNTNRDRKRVVEGLVFFCEG